MYISREIINCISHVHNYYLALINLYFLSGKRNKEVNIYNMNIAPKATIILGIHKGRYETTSQHLNFIDKKPKIYQIHLNSNRNISLCGKMSLTKTLGIAKVNHQLLIIIA